ncbi:hypothetical protein [Lysinibacillus pakistanensis]|uniref:Lipoprotein n=1 Tax=Lysinibacillus pakistanensis TaxID=759811 RepID=A0AAX3WUU6_9BACI|nr:hypothetical protein [Lysinibacillus pakistanensis]MDM5229770.1 hypothetical protein [Lysinibacillus pakistanensis]WHY45373.1 hypothetical protein QNH22_18960 [Lysinibacillus pakistanensis]WHY50381.1 hypothetical protein QNH24_18925 [Lysinibacillus pakistanensis]
MKKLIFSAALVLSLGLAGCGEEKTKEEPRKEDTKTPVSAEQNVQKEESKTDDNEVKEGPLTKAGQWTMDGQDKVTLVKIKEVNQTYKQGPINLTIESVKLLHHSNVADETKEYLKNANGKDVTELNTIQVVYKVENTVDDNVMMMAIDTLTTDTKAQIHSYDNLASSDDTGSYAGQVIVEGMAIFPYFNGTLEDINTIFINTGMTLNSDAGTRLGDSQRIEIAL